MRRLTNASASIAGAAEVPVLFDQAYARADVGFNGMASTQPVATLPTAQVPAAPISQPITVTTAAGSTSYTIAAHEPDGTGMSTLFLELA